MPPNLERDWSDGEHEVVVSMVSMPAGNTAQFLLRNLRS